MSGAANPLNALLFSNMTSSPTGFASCPRFGSSCFRRGSHPSEIPRLQVRSARQRRCKRADLLAQKPRPTGTTATWLTPGESCAFTLGAESPGMSDKLLSRFLRYVRVDTESDETSAAFPSTPGQLVLLEMLKQELSELGAPAVQMTKHGYVIASIPANTR